MKNRLTLKRPQPHPPHTRDTFNRRPQPLYTEKRMLSYPDFLPNISPMQHSCNHQYSCNHCSAICGQKLNKRIELGTHNNHSSQNTKGESKNIKTSVPATPRARDTFHRRLQPLYTKKYKISCSGFLPNTSHMHYSCSH